MKLQVFDGGQSSRLAPQLIQPNQATSYRNIANASGILQPVRDKELAVGLPAVQLYLSYYNFGNEWLSSDTQRDYLEFQRKMYLTNPPQKYSDGTYDTLGIVGPADAPAVFNQYPAEKFDGLRAQNKNDAGDLPIADLSYMVFNSNNGILSAPRAFVVFASDDSLTRVREADAEDALLDGAQIFDWVPAEANPIYEDDDGTIMRSILFDNVRGVFGGPAHVYRWYEGDWRKVGEIADTESSLLDDTLDISASPTLEEATLTAFSGTYQYVYTYYNADDGAESVPSPLSPEVKTTGGRLRVTLPTESLDSQVTHKRLYRVGGNLTSFAMVVQLDAAELIYYDELSESEIDGRQLESENFYEAPADLKHLAESYAMLFGAVDSTLRFTPIGNPNAWPPEYSILFDDDITGIGAVANGVLVFTRTQTFIVTGTGPTSLSQQSLRGDQGCISHASIQPMVRGMVVWASEDGLCASSGNDVQSLTKLPLGDIKLDPVDSVVHNEVYYCHNSDGATLAWDYRFGAIPKWLDLDIEAVAVADNVLYGYKQNLLYRLFDSDNSLTLKYVSPRLTEGSMSRAKTYKKVYIRSEGDIIINILIDDVSVALLELTGKETHQVQVPSHQQRGYYIQFEIEGTGVVHELEYTAGDRKNE